MVLATPVLAMTLLLLALRALHRHRRVRPARIGGDPLLFQHMFWFYSHPAVYIMILPGMGVVSEIIPCFARQADLRLQVHVAWRSMSIAMLGFFVWGHHMFVAGHRSMPAWCSR